MTHGKRAALLGGAFVLFPAPPGRRREDKNLLVKILK